MMSDKDRHLRMKLNNVMVQLMFCISLRHSVPAFSILSAGQVSKGSSLATKCTRFEFRVSSLGDLFFSPERGDVLHCFAACT